MHRDSGDRPQQVVTFNGAGIGQVAQGHTLRELPNRFTALKGKTSGADFGLTDPTLVSIFDCAQQAIAAGGNIAAADRTQLQTLRDTPDELQFIDAQTRADARRILEAVDRVKAIREARDYVKQQINSAGASPVEWQLPQIEAARLERRIAATGAEVAGGVRSQVQRCRLAS